MKQIIATSNAPAAVGPYSQGIVVHDMVFTSGIIGIDPATGQLGQTFLQQAELVFSNARAILAQAGTDFTHLVKVTIYVTDMDNFAQLNQLYATIIPEPFPVRETVQVAALPTGAQVEMSFVALK